MNLVVDKNEIEKYLIDVKQAIKEKRYQVSARDKNEQLFVKYNITEQLREEILLDLQIDDFCEAVHNEHPKFSHEILYVFGKDVYLLPRFGGKERTVSLYIKFNKLENLYCIVISFHEQEYPLKYAFK